MGGATTWWQVLEKRKVAETEYQRALVTTKFAVLRTFAAAYQRSGNVLNRWLVHVLWIAEERNKPSSKRDTNKIKSWASEIVRLQDEYLKAEPLDGVLLQIEGIFAADARATAQNMKKKWKSFEDMMRNVNTKYNVAESLISEDIAEFDKARRAAVQELEVLQSKLLTQMGEDIRGTGK